MHRPIHAIHGPYRADVTHTWSSSLERQHHPNRLPPPRTPCRLARHAATVRRPHPWLPIRRPAGTLIPNARTTLENFADSVGPVLSPAESVGTIATTCSLLCTPASSV